MKRHFFKTLFATSILGLACASLSANDRWEGAVQTSLESSRFDGGNRMTSTLGLELLYWEIHQNNLDYLIYSTDITTDYLRDADTKFIDHGYSLGYRIPYTMHTMRDGLDIHFDVTVFGDTEYEMFSGTTGLHPTFLHPAMMTADSLDDIGSGIDATSARNKITYSTYDFLVSRPTYMTDNFEITPFWGVRILNLTQSFNANYDNGSNLYYSSHDTGKVLAGGVHVGMKNQIYLSNGFSVKGKVAGSIVAGEIKNERMILRGTTSGGTKSVVVDLEDKRHSVMPCYELALGFNWETFMNDNKDYLNIHLSYEFTQWFNTPSQRKFYNAQSGLSGGESEGKLGFNGFSLGATYQF